MIDVSRRCLCAWYFGSTFLIIIVAPIAMGHKSAPAFISTNPRIMDNYFTSSKTRMFFECHQNIEKQEKPYNSTHIATEVTVPGARASSSCSLRELSALSSSFALCDLSDETKKRFDQKKSNACRSRSYKVYCDMDGCLVDFEKGVRMLLNTGSSNLDKRQMWEGISKAPLWFERLDWQMDGKRLWSAIKHLNPDILTGVPDIKSSRVEKFNWCKRELGLREVDAHHVDMAAEGVSDHQSVNGNFPREDKTNIITCWSRNKYKECSRYGSILIDDRIDLKKDWEGAGGIFIHHINTETTIRKLCDIGVISESELENLEDGWYWEGSWRLWKIK